MFIQTQASVLSKSSFLVCVLTFYANAQQPKPPTFDPRIPFSAYIREDLFSGFLSGQRDGDERFLRGERNLEILLAERPQDRPGLIAWKGGIALKRAVDASKAGQADTLERGYHKALNLYTEAIRLAPEDAGVMAITGAGAAIFADHFPEPDRSELWRISYKEYLGLWHIQGEDADRLPVHFKGELLAGMAQAAQRTGQADEAKQFLQRILTTMPDTPYAKVARKWIDSPEQATQTHLICLTCHESGRLEARRAALSAASK